jgi:predicted ester cyclase
MQRTEIQDLLERHKAAFAVRDAAALASQHAEDGTFESPAHGVVSGRGAIEGVYRYWFTAFPDLVLAWPDAVIDGNRAAVFWSFEGKTDGAFFGVEKPGIRVVMGGAADYRFADGYITSVRHVFDFTGALIKAGVLKTRPE